MYPVATHVTLQQPCPSRTRFRTHPLTPRSPTKLLRQSNTKDRRASALEEEGAAPASDGPEEADSSDTKPFTYRAPGGGGGDASAGAIDYVVDRTPHEVAQDLLSSSVDEDGAEEDETGSATDEETEEHDGPETTLQGEEGQGAATAAAADAAASGGDGKKGKGKGKGKGEPAMSAADVAAAAIKNLPRYWRGKFVPLEEEDLQALELEKGEEGLEEYFDKRCGQCVWRKGGARAERPRYVRQQHHALPRAGVQIFARSV